MLFAGSRTLFCFLSQRVFQFLGECIYMYIYIYMHIPDMCPGRLAENLHELYRLQCCSVLFQRRDCFSFWEIPQKPSPSCLGEILRPLRCFPRVSAPLFFIVVRHSVFHRCSPRCLPQMFAPLFSTDVCPDCCVWMCALFPCLRPILPSLSRSLSCTRTPV